MMMPSHHLRIPADFVLQRKVWMRRLPQCRTFSFKSTLISPHRQWPSPSPRLRPMLPRVLALPPFLTESQTS